MKLRQFKHISLDKLYKLTEYKVTTEWLEAYPDKKIRELMLGYYDVSFSITNECSCFSDALSSSFRWSTTPQGHEFWKSIAYNTFKKNNYETQAF